MKILQKLVYVIALFSLMAATPYDSLRNNRVAAVQVRCGGRLWTDGEELGSDNGARIWTFIFENRVYIRKEGNPALAHNNREVLYNTYKNGVRVFPPDVAGSALVNGCVNEEDPSTINNGLLRTTNGIIYCHNNVISDKLKLGTYIGGDGVQTKQYARIINNRLRINFQRDGNPENYNSLSMGLILPTLQGENGSFMNPDMGFTLDYNDIKSCFWKDEPLLATAVTETPACASGPSIQTISDITKTTLRFSFAGTSIPNVKWRILQNGSVFGAGTTGQLGGVTTVDISYNSLNAGTYTLEIQGGDCTSSTSNKSFVVTDPVVVVPNCNGGPTINSITNINSTSLTVNFAGTAIPNLSYVIKSGLTTLASGKTANLTSNSAVINFNNIVNGTYTLEVQGGDCISNVSSSSFVINANCDRGPVLQGVSSVTPQSLDFLFDGNGVYGIDWKIMQGSTMMRQSSVSPQSNRPSINFASLTKGVYTLQIQGGTCNSAVSAMNFGVDGALPIEIASFQAMPVQKGIDLSWKVVSEKNGEGFDILRFNNDLKKSDVIGKVALTEQRMGEYHFLDENPVSGINYYQLKQIDSDGTFTNSKIISAKFDQIFEAFVAPNPASEFVNIQFTSRSSGSTGVEIYNMAGIKMLTSHIDIKEGNNTYQINTGKLTTGHYFVKVLNGDQKTHLRFLKVN